MYDPELVQPMRDELTSRGIEELLTADAVDRVLGEKRGTVLVFVNSVCGCAAGSARPGVIMALDHENKPDKMVTVFAGQDREATDRARGYFTHISPSSPSIGLLREGELVFMIERHNIEGRSPQQIALLLGEAFNEFCTTPAEKSN